MKIDLAATIHNNDWIQRLSGCQNGSSTKKSEELPQLYTIKIGSAYHIVGTIFLCVKTRGKYCPKITILTYLMHVYNLPNDSTYAKIQGSRKILMIL